MTLFRSILAAFALFLTFAAAAPAEAREWRVQMLNRSTSGGVPMVFEPAFIAIQPGDTVRFVPTQRGHNAESIPGMMPAGATPFRGRIDQEIVVRFTVPGLYGYKCLPHLGMGMVGLIQVGRATNRVDFTAAANRLPGLGKRNMLQMLSRVR